LIMNARAAGSVSATATLSAAAVATVGTTTAYSRDTVTHSVYLTGGLRRFRFIALSQSPPADTAVVL
jgi:hypothetical protein